eukprot:CAMPEP_0119156216 /NCGR_PEP_ID=MMETSP1310-20130426/52137_1 /TAXON_ID=464262 /ORGANISM="Genus nov. species nov., Strain RCC2339" /LENGTH=380 /DNA_ID=CAMNT_0007148825 /DNA_START=208 /DNA_END=1350 /DNA_ORIENTATION=+
MESQSNDQVPNGFFLGLGTNLVSTASTAADSIIFPYEFIALSPSLARRIVGGSFVLLSSAFLLRHIQQAMPPGGQRLLASLPFFVLFFFYPLLFHRQNEILMVLISSFYVTWLGSQRLWGLCFDLGHHCKLESTVYFVLGFFSPFRFIPPNTRIAPGERIPKIQDGFLSVVKGTAKFYLLILNMYFSYFVPPGVWRRSLFYGAVTYYGASYMADLMAAVGSIFFGMRLAASFNAPFLSASVAEFWGRRWHLTYTQLQHETIAKPMRKMMEDMGQPRIGLLLSYVLPFVVSAIMAEIVLYHCFGHLTYEWACFFLVQPLGIIAETKLDLARRLSRPLRIIVTLSFLALASELFLWPPLLRLGLHRHICPQYLALVGARVDV